MVCPMLLEAERIGPAGAIKYRIVILCFCYNIDFYRKTGDLAMALWC